MMKGFKGLSGALSAVLVGSLYGCDGVEELQGSACVELEEGDTCPYLPQTIQEGEAILNVLAQCGDGEFPIYETHEQTVWYSCFYGPMNHHVYPYGGIHVEEDFIFFAFPDSNGNLVECSDGRVSRILPRAEYLIDNRVIFLTEEDTCVEEGLCEVLDPGCS